MSRASRVLFAILGAAAGAWLGRAATNSALLRIQPRYFNNKVVLITGASRGIGRALAHAFAEQGAHLVMAARNQQQLLSVASECGAIRLGVQTLVIPTDISREEDLQNLVDTTLQRFGRIDVLINNAGILQGGPFHQASLQSIKSQLEVNLVGAMLLTRLVLPHMLSNGQGHVVIISSQAGRASFPFFTTYSTTKYALRGLCNSIRPELTGTRVHVTAVYPGFVETEMVEETQQAARKMLLPVISPQDVAERTLRGIQLGLAEVNFGWLETFGGWVAAIAPKLVDLYWNVLAPDDFEQTAKRQQSK